MTLPKLRPSVSVVLAILLVSLAFTAFPVSAADPIKIGFVGVMTGPNAQNGEWSSRGAILAVEQINAAGGVQVPGESGKRLLELVIEDDGGAPQSGISAIQKQLYQNNVFAIIGPDYSSITLPSLFLAEEAGVVQITSSLAPEITAQGNEWIFRSRPSDALNAEATVRYFIEDLGLEKIALAFTNIEYGISGINAAEKVLLEKYGMEPVVRVSHAPGDTDLTPSATRIVQSGAEGVIVWGLQTEAAHLVRSLRRLGWDGKFIYSSADDIFVGLLSPDIATGVLGVLSWVPSDPRTSSQEFLNAYQRRFNFQRPDTHSAAYYDAVYLLAHAIENVGLDRTKVRDFLRNLTGWEGIQGTFRYGDFGNGDPGTFLTVFEYENYQPVVKARYE